MKNKYFYKRMLIIAVLACTITVSALITGCSTETENETDSNKSSIVSDTSEPNKDEKSNSSTNSENITESNTIEDSKDNEKSSNDVSKEEKTEVSDKTYGIMSLDEAIKIIPYSKDVDDYYAENDCYSDKRSYNFVCYARIVKDAEKNNFDWQGVHYSFKNGDFIEIQSKDRTKDLIGLQTNPDSNDNSSDSEYCVNTYIGDYTIKSGMMVSFNPENLEFFEPGYTPTEKDNVVMYPTNDISEETTESLSNATADGWTVKKYVDEFGDQTGEEFLTISTPNGKYLWSGNDNELGAALLVDKQSAAILLLEYGNSQATNIFSSDNDYIIKTKDSSGNTKTFEGVMYGNGGDRVILKDYSGFISLLKDGGETKFYVESNINAKYNFTLNLDGFNEAYSQL